MWVIIFATVIAVWAAWVAYEVSKAGGYPPYQDSCNQNCKQGRECECYERSCNMTAEEYNAQWPFPKARP